MYRWSIVAIFTAIEAVLCVIVLVLAPFVVIYSLVTGDTETALGFGVGWLLAAALVWGHLKYWGGRD